MANKNIFKSPVSAGFPANVPASDTVNLAGGKAYAYSDKHAVAQIACTGTFNGTFYASAEDNFKMVKEAVDKMREDPLFVAKLAVYARDKGYMKDMPAYMCAWLAGVDKVLFRKVFRKVIDNGKMLRNAIQMARSGQLGKVYNMSAGTWRHAIDEWFRNRHGSQIFRASVGNDPSMDQIIKMARPCPENDEKRALYAYLIGKPYNAEALPPVVKQYEAYKKDKTGEVPNVDFRFLDSLGLDEKGWTQVALNAGWTMLRMNLNTFQRHGVFKDEGVVRQLADKLRNREEIARAKIFPYQLLTAYQNTTDVPVVLREALQDAMEVAVDNTPVFSGPLAICLDVSGSMSSHPVTGKGAGHSTVTKAIDVAALYGSCVLRKNTTATVVPFDVKVHDTSSLNPRDSVMTNAGKLRKFGGGGTNCALAVEHLIDNKIKADAVMFVSDNESWVDSNNGYSGNGTKLMAAWLKFKKTNPKARLVCIDTSVGVNSQVQKRDDILQVGGFSDNVFDVVNSFLEHGHGDDHWLSEIEKVTLD
jgi:60 kDa SS-A/Ro ribonucleoprotein